MGLKCFFFFFDDGFQGLLKSDQNGIEMVYC